MLCKRNNDDSILKNDDNLCVTFKNRFFRKLILPLLVPLQTEQLLSEAFFLQSKIKVFGG